MFSLPLPVPLLLSAVRSRPIGSGPGSAMAALPPGLAGWSLAVVLLTCAQLRLPSAGSASVWQGLIALSLSVTLVSAIAARAVLEGLLLLLFALAAAFLGGSSALLPLAAAGAALTFTLPPGPPHAAGPPRHPGAGDMPPGESAILSAMPALLPALAALWLSPAQPIHAFAVQPVMTDPALIAIGSLVLGCVLALCRLHPVRVTRGHFLTSPGGVAALLLSVALFQGKVSGSLTAAMPGLLLLAAWLALLLSALLPRHPLGWGYRRASIAVAACSLGCWWSAIAPL